MIKATVASVTVLISLLLPGAALAQQQAPSASSTELSRQERLRALKIQEEARLQDAAQSQNVGDSSTTLQLSVGTGATTARLAERQALFEARQKAFKADLKARVDAFNANLQSHKDDLTQRLLGIRSTAKRDIVQSIDDRFATINANVLARYTESLTKIQAVFTDINARQDASQSQGVDVSAVDDATAKASANVALARTAIINQTGKSYTIDISSEATLRADVQHTRDALHADLEKVRVAVAAVAESVRDVNAALHTANASIIK